MYILILHSWFTQLTRYPQMPNSTYKTVVVVMANLNTLTAARGRNGKEEETRKRSVV